MLNVTSLAALKGMCFVNVRLLEGVSQHVLTFKSLSRQLCGWVNAPLKALRIQEVRHLIMVLSGLESMRIWHKMSKTYQSKVVFLSSFFFNLTTSLSMRLGE